MQYESYILIVDDTREHIQLAGTTLLKQGYHIRVATSGKSCLKMVEKQLPSLILLDIQLPDIDGFTLCQSLKENPLTTHIPIIFVTADNDRQSLQKGLSIGGQDYILKPYHAHELIARVRVHMQLHIQSLKLQSAYDELNQFCHSVSHDLKAPLQVINQLVDVLEEESMHSPINTTLLSQVFNQIHTKCTATLTMIERLLDFSKMSELSCHYEAVDFSLLVPAIFRDLKSLTPHSTIVLRCDNLPIISGDATLIALLLQNIISNAIKFTQHHPQATLTVVGHTTEQGYQINFTDNGVGFDMAYVDRLFHVFERLHSQEEYPGSGVGLAIVKRIMEKHNGCVSITSDLNQGTTVTLSFPSC